MLESDFLGFINDKRLFEPTDCVLLAVSGGLDSMVMADLFHRTNQRFAIAHVNFGLRGTESADDATFVQNCAKQYGVPFHLTHVNTAVVAAERGVSIQMAARDLRYDWFAQLIGEHSYAGVATAHHQNDVLETLLLNLTRGTGLAGLHGIAARQGNVIRPVLFATRDQLAAHAETHSLTYREDRSNADDKYARNRIRHHVVPILTSLNPGLWQSLPRTVERLRAAEMLVWAELNRSWQSIAEPYGAGLFLPADTLLAQPELAFRLAEWLKSYGFTSDQTGQMVESLSRETGQLFRSTTHQVTHDRLPNGTTGLLLESLPARSDYEITLTEWPDAPVNVAGHFTLTIALFGKPTDFRPSTDPNMACLDADRLTLPVTIRPWRQGDRFRPLGLNGTKLVSDLLNDLKLPRPERDRTAVLLSGDQIVWVIGRRIAHSFRVTGETKRIGRISFVNE
ncbi:tRNA lysidine(34) synthetase TilS [Spirosoma arcticum]